MSDCIYNPIYRICQNCGQEMQRSQTRECPTPGAAQERVVDRERAIGLAERRMLLLQVRAMILRNATSCWRGGLTDRSDALTDLLHEFDREFPEVIT